MLTPAYPDFDLIPIGFPALVGLERNEPEPDKYPVREGLGA